MAKTRPVHRTIISDAATRRAARARSLIDEAINAITTNACPSCGRRTLVYDSERYSSGHGVFVYCDRPLCNFK
jgi:hypothetical protein